MILVGKSHGKPKFGCPMCSAFTPYIEDGTLYKLSDLLDLHEVLKDFLILRAVFLRCNLESFKCSYFSGQFDILKNWVFYK